MAQRRHRFCGDACRETDTREMNLPTFLAAGPAALAKRRAEGDNPNGMAAGRAKIGRRNGSAPQRGRSGSASTLANPMTRPCSGARYCRACSAYRCRP